ncbi:MAG: VOC family protein [Thermoleophilaceae bacterium]
MTVTIDQIAIADAPEAWEALGFSVVDGELRLGAVRVRLAGGRGGRGILGWSLRGARTTKLDGLETELSERPPVEPGEHANGVTRIDHVVAISPDLDRTVAVLRAAGLDLRRIREEPTPAGAPRQAFFRLGAEILEVIQEPDPDDPARPARLWGLALVADDLEAAAGHLGERAGSLRDAVQDGRRILPLRRSAGLGVPVALMSPAGERERTP